DVTGDNKLDIILGNLSATNQLYVNNGATGTAANPFNGVLAKDISADTGVITTVAVVDMNGDGRKDILFGGSNQLCNLYINNHTADPFNKVVADVLSPAPEITGKIDESILFQVNLFAAFLRSTATSEITLGSSSNITASGDVTIIAHALANAQNITAGFFLG